MLNEESQMRRLTRLAERWSGRVLGGVALLILGLALVLPARPFERNLEAAAERPAGAGPTAPPATAPRIFAVDTIRDALGAPPQIVHLLHGAFRARSGSDVIITGWVLDPATPRSFAKVLVTIDGRDVTKSAVVGIARPDVVQVTGANNGRSGFESSASTRGLSRGAHTLGLLTVSEDGHRSTLPVQVPLVLE